MNLEILETPEERRRRKKRESRARYHKKYPWKRSSDRLREDPAFRLYRNARDRAREYALPFNITRADVVIPERCPVFGVLLEVGTRDGSPNSPSLDRIVPELGYVVGNVMVISMRANTIKNSGNSADHRMIADWIDRFS
jgi:hypothetical protein